MASRSTPTTETEIAAAFARIEEELIASMMRNFKRHQVEEVASGFKWQQWQTEQLASLNEYTKKNLRTYGRQFDQLNTQVERLVEASYIRAGKAEDARIRDAVAKGFQPVRQMEFFKVPEERLNALVGATHSDMMKAEYAVLRRSTDIYRSTIFDAQVYAQSGAGTYAQAIDMATKDFLAKGIDGIVYSNGSRHTIREYSQMAIRTSTKRATFAAEGDMRGEWGVHTIIVNYRDDACPECMDWVGEVLIDDVYSGGSSKDGDYPLLSEAMDAGLFHPNCRDTSTTYFPGVTEVPERPSKAAQSRAEAREEVEQLENTAENNERRYERLSEYSLAPENKARYEAKAEEWGERAEVAHEAIDLMARQKEIEWPTPSARITNEDYAVLSRAYQGSGVAFHSSFDGAKADASVARMLADSAVEARRMLPQLEEVIGERPITFVLDYGMGANDFARVMPNKPWQLHINAMAARDAKALAKEYAAAVSEGWFVQGTNETAIVHHELGHLMKRVYNINPEKLAMEVAKVNSREALAHFLKQNLSEYASVAMGDEILAEVMAAWLGNTDNEFAKRYMKALLAHHSQ